MLVILATMPGHEHDLAIVLQERIAPMQCRCDAPMAACEVERHQQRVDHRVARDNNRITRYGFSEQIVSGEFSRCEVVRAHKVDHPPVQFLGPRLREVPGAQARFHVSNVDVRIERGQGRGHRGGCITVHEYACRFHFREDVRDAGENVRTQRGKVLIVAHQVKINIGVNLEVGENLVEHLTVLGGGAHNRAKTRLASQTVDYRRHLDGFGPGADDNENCGLGHDRSTDKSDRMNGDALSGRMYGPGDVVARRPHDTSPVAVNA
ncbi:hypothetical protein BN2476_630069 [Paraburkholderia piptadeniae]|uniref:Uncharacterized protein n=1 Tax=Paraburkholderia piptadeniae TaxID=1701573 RepID=A0A1N7SLF7_9BURK|nr:hypothetical protein BN2476_630069 [Paraburkholderia piptadeniae]